MRLLLSGLSNIFVRLGSTVSHLCLPVGLHRLECFQVGARGLSALSIPDKYTCSVIWCLPEALSLNKQTKPPCIFKKCFCLEDPSFVCQSL